MKYETNKLETELDICNMALSKLGELPISTIDPNGTPAQRLCYMHYHPVRREVLCASNWQFSTKIVKLTSEEAGAFRIPQDCIRIVEVSDTDWTLRGRRIFCASSTIELTYISDIEDVTCFDSLFTEAFAARLACKLCIPLTSSTVKRQKLASEYEAKKGGSND